MGKVPVQMSTNGSQQLPGHFTRENERSVFEFIRASIDDLFVITTGDWSNNVEKLELTIKYLKENGVKFNIEKSFFGQDEMEYLGFWVT